jgi:hypothetical protein
VIAFTNWVLTIHLGKLKEARVNIDPNNDELQSFSAACHNERILPPLRESGTNPFGIAGTTSQPRNPNHEVFKSLGEGLKQMGEAVDETNSLKREEIKLKGEEEM